MIEDFCQFFAAIEKDPTALIAGITVRDQLQAAEHLSNCDACYNRSERVLAKAPKPTVIDSFTKN